MVRAGVSVVVGGGSVDSATAGSRVGSAFLTGVDLTADLVDFEISLMDEPVEVEVVVVELDIVVCCRVVDNKFTNGNASTVVDIGSLLNC